MAQQEKREEVLISRRDVIRGSIAATAALAAGSMGSAVAATGHMHHGSNKNQHVIDTAMDCIKDGNACLDHCMQSFKTGDTSLADCAESVNKMLAMCTAVSQMAAYNAENLGELAKVCMKECEACKSECDKHASKHEACKMCADSCKECAKACQSV